MRTSHRLAVTLLALLGAALYANTFGVPWYLDDYGAIVDQPAIRDLSSSLRGVLAPRGLGSFTFALNYWAGGVEPAGYHLVNLAVHLLAGIAAYYLLLRVFRGSALAAFAGAAIFLAHPLQTEAVTYVVQRLASLSALFFLLALLCWVKAGEARQDGGRFSSLRHLAWVGTSVLLAAAAIQTKGNAVVLPAAMWLFGRSFLAKGRGGRRELAELAPFVLLSVTAGIRELALPLLRGGTLATLVHAQQPAGPLSYFATELGVLWIYLGLLVWPVGQALDHDHPIVRSILSPTTAAAAAGLLALMLLAFRMRRRNPRLAFGIAWFLLTLGVESSFIPLDPIFEHRLYLPMFGFAIAVVEALRRIPWRRTAAAATVAALAACGALTLRRNALWNDPISFLEDNLRLAPRQPRIHLALAIGYMERDRPREAIPLLEEALRLDPRSAKPYANLGRAYEQIGDLRRAEAYYEAAIATEPRDALTHTFLADLRASRGDWAEAEAAERRAIALDPSLARAHLGLALMLERRGRRPEAKAELRESLRLDPLDADAWYHGGRLAIDDGDLAGAGVIVARLRSLDPDLARKLDERLAEARSAASR